MIIDTASDVTPYLDAFKATDTVIRYFNPIDPTEEKCIKTIEAQAIAKAGLHLALVCEGWGDFAHGGISSGAGERDGAWCTKYAPTIGAPAGACIYYAVDVDATATQIKRLVLPYFTSIRAQHKSAQVSYRVGVYGSGTVCSAVKGAGLADLSWLSCSLGWSGTRPYLATKKWALAQHLPTTIAGIDCDPNDANGDFGGFMPFDASSTIVAPPSAAPSRPINLDNVSILSALEALIAHFRSAGF